MTAKKCSITIEGERVLQNGQWIANLRNEGKRIPQPKLYSLGNKLIEVFRKPDISRIRWRVGYGRFSRHFATLERAIEHVLDKRARIQSTTSQPFPAPAGSEETP